MPLKMTIEEMTAFLARDFPQVCDDFVVEELAEGRVTVRLKVGDKHLRPGGTISGPSMFALADVAFYLATLGMIGPKALTVTTHCSINFMRKPKPGDMLAEARILKLGRVLSVGDVMLFSEGAPEPMAHAKLTYSIPPEKPQTAP
jgi:uncharacterized protein (TIGR00369 family)